MKKIVCLSLILGLFSWGSFAEGSSRAGQHDQCARGCDCADQSSRKHTKKVAEDIKQGDKEEERSRGRSR